MTTQTGRPLEASDVARCREQFPALAREVDGRTAVFFDGPAGTQVPQSVIDAVAHAMAHLNANHGGLFATSRESDQMLHDAHCAAADLVGSDDPDTIAFGPNMTTLCMALSRALARTWQPGDNIVVSRLDHDANVSPWTLAARDAGVEVRHIAVRPGDCTLDLDDYRSQLSDRTRLVAVGCASNATGTLNPVAEMIPPAHDVGALVSLDAVHYAPHALMDVTAWQCDFLLCSAYKFFGPHIGLMWGRRELLESLPAYKLRPASDALPDKWMTGTQSHEGIAGTLAAIDYLAELGRRVTNDTAPTGAAPTDAGQTDTGPPSNDRRAAIVSAMAAIRDYESGLATRLLEGIARMPAYRVWGITEPSRADQRLPTVAITHPHATATEMAQRLGQRGIFSWHGNYYALPLTEALGLEPEGMLRIGLVHYNTADEVDRLLDELAVIDGSQT